MVKDILRKKDINGDFIWRTVWADDSITWETKSSFVDPDAVENEIWMKFERKKKKRKFNKTKGTKKKNKTQNEEQTEDMEYTPGEIPTSINLNLNILSGSIPRRSSRPPKPKKLS